ncbi:cation:proton antiporter domain-containing protein [Paraliomyxa miuraensis]|uniref:cation:proton antiporter domain-containing protein n=1 Tax=Paraliomyxa miuraensis TaxID=376150 RepID=UPI0022579D6D|nr:cation:proton antiporter [Paraliomyxa miuraensis]MCX4239785.1 cation:proton antiporter [Paraliomyxa miuraensis]
MAVLASGIAPHHITVFLLSVGVMLGLARFLGEAARRMGQPAVLGELLAGIILGPTVLGAVAPEAWAWLFPELVDPARDVYDFSYVALEMLVTLSAVLLLLVAGLEVDLSSAFRQGRATILVSLTGMIIPFGIGFVLAWFLPGPLGLGPELDRLPFALFVGIALAITALPVIARILMDLNMAKSDFGALIMSSAMINDLVGWIGFAVVLAMVHTGTSEGHGLGLTIALTLVFVATTLTAGRWLIHRAFPWLQANLAWPGGVLAFVFVLAMVCAAFTEWLGIHSIFGAFIVGVAVGDSPRLTRRAKDTIHDFVSNIFAPLFFASIGLRLHFTEAFDPPLVAIVLAVAILGKVLGSYTGARLARLGPRRSWAIGFGMVGRGAMEIILGQLAYNHGLIGEELLVALIVMALVTSMLTGPMMQWLLKGKRPRRLGEVLTHETFIPALRATDPRNAIAELAAAAAAAAPGVDARELAREAWRRERITPTGLANGIAVPYGHHAGVRTPLVVLGLSHAGIDFDAPDRRPAHLVCLLVTEMHDFEAQLELLEMVAHAFATPEARAAVRSAGSLTQLKAALTTTALADDEHAPEATGGCPE